MMKKKLFAVLFLLFLGFFSPSNINAGNVICPDRYNFDETKDKCCITHQGGVTCNVDPSCPSGENYSTTAKTCVTPSKSGSSGGSTTTSVSGCSGDSSGRTYCTSLLGQSIYCSTSAECDDFKKQNSNSLGPAINQNQQSVTSGDKPKPLTELEGIFGNVVQSAIALAGIILFIMLLVGGFKYITAGPDPKAAAAARGTITFAIIGMVFIALAFLILRLLADFTGVEGILNFQIALPN